MMLSLMRVPKPISLNHYHPHNNSTHLIKPHHALLHQNEARKAQCEADHIWLQQEEEADLREQERLEKKGEERLVREAEIGRLEEVRRKEEAAEIVQRQKGQKRPSKAY